MSFAQDERSALCALLDESGPDAPTLCDGWETRDLAAHLLLRERRPDAAIGVALPRIRLLAGYAERVQRQINARPYREVVDMIRHGPPRLSLWAIPGADEQGNAVEYFVHHEDVRRAAPGNAPRELGAAADDLLWRRLRLARFLLRSAPCGVILQRDGAQPADGAAGGTDTAGTADAAADQPSADHAGADKAGAGKADAGRITAKPGVQSVTVSGPPGELILWATGRTSAAQVRLDGSEDTVQRLRNARWGL